MGRFKLDRAGVNKIRKMLRHQVTEVQKSFAVEAFSYFMNFGYHVDGGGPEDGGGGWSLYYHLFDFGHIHLAVSIFLPSI